MSEPATVRTLLRQVRNLIGVELTTLGLRVMDAKTAHEIVDVIANSQVDPYFVELAALVADAAR